MKVAICDDFKGDQKILYDLTSSIFKEKRIDVKIDCYDSGEALWQNALNDDYDIYFLDIYMKELNGVKLGYDLIKKYPNAAIVFTTSSNEHMAESYDIGAVHYLIKPFSKNEVEVAIERCLRIVQRVEPYLELLINREKRKILTSKIKYIESQSRYCFIHTDKEKYKVYMQLEVLEKMLKENKFLRCHRSYIVNLDYVKKIVDYDFLLDNGILIPLKRNQKRVFKNYYEDYLFDQTRMKRSW